MYITAEEYASVTGQAPPDNFGVLAAAAQAVIDVHTLYGYQGRDASSLPSPVQSALKTAMAYQISYLADMGLEAVNEGGFSGVTLGKFSTAAAERGAGDALANMAGLQLPFLLSYIRGGAAG